MVFGKSETIGLLVRKVDIVWSKQVVLGIAKHFHVFINNLR